MPVLDGYDATRLIRQDDDPNVRSVLIVAMTASAIQGDKEKCLEAGMNDYLAKPVRAASLKSMMEQYLSQSSPQIENLQHTAQQLVREVSNQDQATIAAETAPATPKTKRPSLPQRLSSRKTLHRVT